MSYSYIVLPSSLRPGCTSDFTCQSRVTFKRRSIGRRSMGRRLSILFRSCWVIPSTRVQSIAKVPVAPAIWRLRQFETSQFAWNLYKRRYYNFAPNLRFTIFSLFASIAIFTAAIRGKIRQACTGSAKFRYSENADRTNVPVSVTVLKLGEEQGQGEGQLNFVPLTARDSYPDNGERYETLRLRSAYGSLN